MYKLVAADDEVTALKFIEYCIREYKLPVTLVGTAMDGHKAIEEVDALCPDIVILDIKMPLLSGLEVGKYIAEKHPGTKVIMLTAYNEFDFAREAIRFSAFDYLSKPVMPEQLIEVINKAVDQLTEERRTEEQIHNRDIFLESLKPSLQQQAITFLITRGTVEPTIMQNEGLLNLQANCECIGYLSAWEVETGQMLHERSILQGLANEFNELLGIGLFVFLEARGEIVFYSEMANLQVRKLKEALTQKSDHSKYGYVLTIAKLENFSGVPEAFQSTRDYCLQQVFWHKPGAYFINEPVVENKQYGDSALVKELERELQGSYFTLEGSKLAERTGEIIAAICQFFVENQVAPAQCKSYFAELVTVIGWSFSEKKVEVTFIEELKADIGNKIRKAENFYDIESAIKEYNDSLIDLLLQPESKNSEQVVRWIENYLRVNYRQNITLEHLSDKVYLSPCYVSRIFKQITGESFMHYLTKIRMDTAVELLRTGKYGVSEVADSVGYKDSSYFSQSFKKLVGVNPSELTKR